jgi:hypothetical protein
MISDLNYMILFKKLPYSEVRISTPPKFIRDNI